jgi:hypothetical protein
MYRGLAIPEEVEWTVNVQRARSQTPWSSSYIRYDMARPMATHSGMNPGYVALRYSGFIGVGNTVSIEFLISEWF